MKWFALVDCNNFYASTFRLFEPELIGKPVAVLSNNDGCVIARSYEAKALGIKMGEVYHLNKDRFQDMGVAIRSSCYAYFGDLSDRVMRILMKYTPEAEVYSVDEIFLKFTGFDDNIDLRAHMLAAIEEVRQCTGIPISVGIAPTKALAKVANKIAKKYAAELQSVHWINSEDLRIKGLKWTEIHDVWGIGRQHTKKLITLEDRKPERIPIFEENTLKRTNIATAYDFTLLDDAFVKKEFSIVGLRLLHEQAFTTVVEINFSRLNVKGNFKTDFIRIKFSKINRVINFAAVPFVPVFQYHFTFLHFVNQQVYYVGNIRLVNTGNFVLLFQF